MKGSTFLSMMTGGIFDGLLASEGEAPSPERPRVLSPVMDAEERGLKRSRDVDGSTPTAGSRTPMLLASRHIRLDDAGSLASEDERAPKRLRGERMAVPVPMRSIADKSNSQLQSDLLRMVPEEVVGHVLSFLGSTEDRFALQCTSVQFRRISNSDEMLTNVKLGGEIETGKNGIVQEEDTPETAAVALTPFARAGNLEAIYMLGMIKSYCNHDVERGIFLLKLASSRGCVRSSYALGLILRDSLPEEATRHMKRAAEKGYLPALQETLPAREMKVKYGEPDAAALRRHLDPYCLNRLLGRHYLHCTQLRDVNTSHCWNPLCGRWAYKATAISSHGPNPVRRNFAFAFYRHPVEVGRVSLPPRHNHEHSGSSMVHPHVGHRHGTSDEDPRQHGSDQGAARTVGHVHTHSEVVAGGPMDVRVSRMKMCSRCCRAKYCSKLCQVYDWRSGRHKMECQFL